MKTKYKYTWTTANLEGVVTVNKPGADPYYRHKRATLRVVTRQEACFEVTIDIDGLVNEALASAAHNRSGRARSKKGLIKARRLKDPLILDRRVEKLPIPEHYVIVEDKP